MQKCLLHKLSIIDDIFGTIFHPQEHMTESLMPLRGPVTGAISPRTFVRGLLFISEVHILHVCVFVCFIAYLWCAWYNILQDSCVRAL